MGVFVGMRHISFRKPVLRPVAKSATLAFASVASTKKGFVTFRFSADMNVAVLDAG